MNKLNLGSVVQIKGNDKKLLVIAYNKKDEDGDVQRYEAIEHPKGIKKSKFYYFSDQDIIKILDKGYVYGG